MCLYKQLHACQFVQEDTYQTVRQVRVNGKAVSRKGLQPGSEVLADAAREQQDKRVAIAPAELVADTLEGIGLQALVSVAELCTEQADAP